MIARCWAFVFALVGRAGGGMKDAGGVAEDRARGALIAFDRGFSGGASGRRIVHRPRRPARGGRPSPSRPPPADIHGASGLEAWIAAQRWEAAPGGWAVPGRLWGWRFRVERAPGGVRVVASADGRGDMEWTVPAAPERTPP